MNEKCSFKDCFMHHGWILIIVGLVVWSATVVVMQPQFDESQEQLGNCEENNGICKSAYQECKEEASWECNELGQCFVETPKTLQPICLEWNFIPFPNHSEDVRIVYNSKEENWHRFYPRIDNCLCYSDEFCVGLVE